jgi:hypothetical protein
MKQPLPAKYAKMTVCTFWILKQLKTMNILTDEQMEYMATHFHLFKENEDQMLFFKDLVENFKEHENYLKMFVNARHLMQQNDNVDNVDNDNNTNINNNEQPQKHENKKTTIMTESELIDQLLLLEEFEEENQIIKNEQPPQKLKIKLVIKNK